MKGYNYFLKTVSIILTCSILSFITSFFIYPGTERENVAVIAFLIGFFLGVVFLVMLLVKKWRKSTYVPLAGCISTVIIVFMFGFWDGLHYTRDLEKSIWDSCISYCEENETRINDLSSLSLIKIEKDTTSVFDKYKCIASAEIYPDLNVDTLIFYAEVDKYNRSDILDSYHVKTNGFSSTQLSYIYKSGCKSDKELPEDWESFWEYLRQAAARSIHYNERMVEDYFEEGTWHVTMEITPETRVRNLQIVFSLGIEDEDGFFSYKKTAGIVKWDGTLQKNRTYRHYFNINTQPEGTTHYKFFILTEDVFSDTWLENYLLKKIDNYLFWVLYADYEGYQKREHLLIMDEGGIAGTYLNQNVGEDFKAKFIIRSYGSLFRIAYTRFFIDQFQDTKYTLGNIKKRIESRIKE